MTSASQKTPQIQKRLNHPTPSLEIPDKWTDEKDTAAGESRLYIVCPESDKKTFLNKTILGILQYREVWGGVGDSHSSQGC